MTTISGRELLPQPLLVLTEDEQLFRDNIRKFAEESVRPLVREMDERGSMDHSLIEQFHQLGLMGIEIPEQYGGGGGTFFEAILAVEELSRVDPSVGVLVDVQNTLVNNALLRWASDAQKQQYLPKMAAEWVGSYALSEAGSGSDAFALQTRAEDKGDHWLLNGQKLWITNGKESNLFIIIATVDPAAGYKGITAFLVEKDFPGFSIGKKEDKLGIRASSTTELIFDDCRVPEGKPAGRGRQGLQDRNRDPERGPYRHWRADARTGPGRLGVCREICSGAQTIRPTAHPLPGRLLPARADGDGDHLRSPDGLQRRSHEGCRSALLEGSGDDEALCFPGG